MIIDSSCGRPRAQRSLGVLLFAAFLLFSLDGHAQERNAGEVDRLREEAEKAVDQGRLVDAFPMFTSVYAVTHELWAACNAGRIAYRLHKIPEAHRYLSACDALGAQAGKGTLDADQRRKLEGARSELALVRTLVARLTVFVNKLGADVFVDGTRVGTVPIQGEIVLEPGRHRVKATLAGVSTEQVYEIAAGELRAVELRLQEPTLFAAPEAPAPRTTPAAGSEPGESPLKEAATSSPKKTSPSKAPRPAPSPRTWPRVLMVAAAGAALVGAGIVAGSYVGSSGSARGAQEYGATLETRGCSAGTSSCGRALDAEQGSNAAVDVGKVGLATATLGTSFLLTAGLVGYFCDPARSTPATEAPSRAKPVKIEATPTVGGLVIRGTF